MKNSIKGITLVALVITIVVLIILAGVTINLIMGNKGIINRASSSKNQYVEAEIKEELEMKVSEILIDNGVQNPSQEDFEKMRDNGIIIESEEMPIRGIYKDYEFILSSKYEVTILGNNKDGKAEFNVNVNNNNISITVTSTFEQEVESYNYYINGELKESSRSNTYNISLEPQTTYRTMVVIKLVNGEKIYTEQKEVTTQEKRVYLYKDGEKYNDITGGYKFNVVLSTDVSSQDNTFLYMYAHSRYGVGYGDIQLYTNNAIDVTEYSTINFDMDYKVNFGQENWRTWLQYGLDGKINTVYGTNSSTGNVISMDISELSGSYKPYFRIYSASSNSDVWVKIRQIYLE